MDVGKNPKLQNLPLAARLRPNTLSEFSGQQHLLAPGKPLHTALQSGHLHSMILWGPPGTGKTTLAKLLAHYANAHVETLSAVTAGVKELRSVITTAHTKRAELQQATVVFIDEIHRFNQVQQDVLLPYVEEGLLTLIGATTENPAFALSNALLSRVRVYILKSLTTDEIQQILSRALSDTHKGVGERHLRLSKPLLMQLAAAADGDARRALNLLERAAELAADKNESNEITAAIIKAVLTPGTRRFDKGSDIFYEQISALHKAIRGSAPDAALYWLARMLDGGCDPQYLARRLVRIASEDIGNADPRALELTLNAWMVQERLGTPEGELALAQAVLYLAATVKSNAVYQAFKAAQADVKEFGSLEVPLELRNAPTQLQRKLNYGKNYRYAHDEPDAYAAGVNYFPQQLAERHYYQPVARGLEIKIGERLAYLKALDAKAKNKL